MPGRFFLTTPLSDLGAALGLDLNGIQTGPRANVAPGEEILAVTEDRQPRMMRWGLIPQGRVNARGRPVLETLINARGETVFRKSAFAGLKRAIVPADGWYEWTGKARAKTAWRLRRADGAPLAFAAVWDVWTAPGGREIAQVATVTCEPNREVAEIHHRMGVILAQDDFATWLDGVPAQAEALIRPATNGSIGIAKATGVDWDAP
ncbi:MAG: SOS response-associated peptidase [Pseudomonadota bacterium]